MAMREPMAPRPMNATVVIGRNSLVSADRGRLFLHDGGGMHRRDLLRGAGSFLLASAVPHSAGAGPVGPVMERLSTYMSAARERALPEAVAEKTKHHVLDTLAAMVSGAELLPGRKAIEFARSY